MHTDPEIRTIASSVVYTDNWIRLRKDDIERRDGSRGTYAVVERGDFALIVPAENAGFHLVEEYRYPVRRRSWSFPQGGFPHGETGTPEELARMELAQETGLRAGRLTHLGSLTASHGMSSQSCDYFLATDLVPGPPDPEPEELGIRHEWVTREEFEKMVRDTRITDDSTLAAYALLLLAERRGEVTIPLCGATRRPPSHRRHKNAPTPQLFSLIAKIFFLAKISHAMRPHTLRGKIYLRDHEREEGRESSGGEYAFGIMSAGGAGKAAGRTGRRVRPPGRGRRGR